MEITQELLTRYYQGDCTQEEQKAVEEWMVSPESEISFPEGKDMNRIIDTMWSKFKEDIGDENPPERESAGLLLYVGRLYPYAAAACLLLAVFSIAFLYQKTMPDVSVVMENTEETSIHHQAYGLNFTLAPESSMKMVTDLKGATGQISFCGAIEVKNESEAITQIDFYSGCERPACKKKTVPLGNGRSYMAISYPEKDCERLIVVPRCDVKNLPLKIRLSALKEFSI